MLPNDLFGISTKHYGIKSNFDLNTQQKVNQSASP